MTVLSPSPRKVYTSKVGGPKVDDTIVKQSPSKRFGQSARELFRTKYRLELQTLPNSIDNSDSSDDDRTTTCSNASSDYVNDARDALPFNVWGTLAPGSIEDMEDNDAVDESFTRKLSGDFLQEAFSAATTASTGAGLMRIGNRLIWVD